MRPGTDHERDILTTKGIKIREETVIFRTYFQSFAILSNVPLEATVAEVIALAFKAGLPLCQSNPRGRLTQITTLNKNNDTENRLRTGEWQIALTRKPQNPIYSFRQEERGRVLKLKYHNKTAPPTRLQEDRQPQAGRAPETYAAAATAAPTPATRHAPQQPPQQPQNTQQQHQVNSNSNNNNSNNTNTGNTDNNVSGNSKHDNIANDNNSNKSNNNKGDNKRQSNVIQSKQKDETKRYQQEQHQKQKQQTQKGIKEKTKTNQDT